MNFSVLMSIYKNDNPVWLEKAISSVMNNTVVPNEFVIVIDGEITSELEAVISNYQNNPLFRIVGYPTNKGLGEALNFGLNYCRYNLVARMDSDDICDKQRFEKQLIVFEKYNADIVGSNVAEFYEDPKSPVDYRVVPETNSKILVFSRSRNPFNHPSVMFKKQQVKDAGGYLDIYRHEDYFLWYRMLKAGAVAYNIQENLVYMRISEDFYKRRGGKKVFKARNQLNKIMYKDHSIGFFRFLLNFFLNVANCVLPSFMRKLVHNKVLRKKHVS